MGEVYRARDAKLQRDVALKILPERFSNDPERVARFRREAQALAALSHSNIAAIFDLQESSSIRFLVMEYVAGDTLAQRLSRGALPLDEALDVATQIANALEAAHEKGIMHRDLKPANIKITPEGKVKVPDFGLAKIFSEESPLSGLSNSPTLVTAGSITGTILGTAAYMSPEQARGRTVDKRADVWAFGAVLFEMLVGGQVFEGETATELLGATCTKNRSGRGCPRPRRFPYAACCGGASRKIRASACTTLPTRELNSKRSAGIQERKRSSRHRLPANHFGSIGGSRQPRSRLACYLASLPGDGCGLRRRARFQMYGRCSVRPSICPLKRP
jgi:serine/threonine-protein kinase